MAGRTGVLLVNLGTPASPAVPDVRRYLREFLGDPRVIDLPRLARWLLLHAVILPFRPARSAAAYAKIWTHEGSPLLVHGRALARAVDRALGERYVTALAMRYGEPSIADGLEALRAADVERIVLLPLFPQYSTAATGSVLARTFELASTRGTPPIESLPAFYDDPAWIAAWVEVAGPGLEAFAPDHVLFSYHGLPERQIRAADPTGAHCLTRPDCCEIAHPAARVCYRAQCFATTRALAGALALPSGAHGSSFQSRLGRTPWIQPYTDVVIEELRARGVRRLAVLCPAFVADCLETLEEVGIRLREQWLALGGEDFWLSPCPNAAPAFVAAVASWVRAAVEGDRTDGTEGKVEDPR